MSLNDWARNGWLVEHRTTRQEITDLVRQLDAFRKKRNIGDYERAGLISETESREMVALAQTLRQRVQDWLQQNHPHLLPESSLAP